MVCYEQVKEQGGYQAESYLYKKGNPVWKLIVCRQKAFYGVDDFGQ